MPSLALWMGSESSDNHDQIFVLIFLTFSPTCKPLIVQREERLCSCKTIHNQGVVLTRTGLNTLGEPLSE